MRANGSKYSKVDPAHILDGLFVPRRKKGEALYDVEGPFDGGKISFKGVQLGVQHQSVLFAVAARTGRQKKCDGLVVNGTSDDLLASQKSLFQLTGPAEDKDFSRVECSAYALLKDAGMGDSKGDYERLKELLHEMATVTLRREVNGKGGTSRLLSYQCIDDRLIVSLNWRMTDAIFGGQNIQISLHERNQLSSPVSKILHTWLSAYVRRGASLMAGRGAAIDTLLNHVYGKRPCKDSAKRNRRQYVRAALKEIGNIEGWGVELEDGRAYVSRTQVIDIMEDVPPGDLAEAEKRIIQDISGR
jgi:hypothetical protein